MSPLYSIVIPAFNEEKRIGATIDGIRAAFAASGVGSFEVIVVDDSSTDATAEIAFSRKVKLVQCRVRNIAASRNSGASEALGERILFVDADTLPSLEVFREMHEAFSNSQVVGGGSRIEWSEPTRPIAQAAIATWNALARTCRLAAGSFFFARRDAFAKVGGFDEKYFIGEEIFLARKLKRLGRFVVLKNTVRTSPRKVSQFTMSEHFNFLRKALVSPIRTISSRKDLDIWYTRR